MADTGDEVLIRTQEIGEGDEEDPLMCCYYDEWIDECDNLE